MSGLSKYQLERADLLTTIEQGRRVETELFAENSRGLRTMGELLKARLFGSTQWAINLRKRMTNYVQGGRGMVSGESPERSLSKSHETPRPPEPHQWPCGDPYCQPCDDAVKRLLRDCGILPRKGGRT
jgi:hypothetical protein